MSGPIAPPWLVFPLAGIAMVITAGYLIALREAPSDMIAPRQARIRTATGWLTLITLPLTAYGFGVTTTADPKTFMLVWVTVTALLAFIFLLASIDLLSLAAERRRLVNEHRESLRQARVRSVRLASGAPVPVSDVSYSTHGPRMGTGEGSVDEASAVTPMEHDTTTDPKSDPTEPPRDG